MIGVLITVAVLAAVILLLPAGDVESEARSMRDE